MRIKLYAVFCLALLMPFSTASAAELRILTEELKPYNYKDESTGKPTGFCVELVTAMLERTGIKAVNGKIEVFPWARAFKMVQQNRNTLLFTMTRTDKRAGLFKWVGPVASRSIWFWKLKGRDDIVARSLEEAKQYRVGGALGYAVSNYLKGLNFTVDYSGSAILAYRMLIYKRVELTTGTELTAAYYMRENGRHFSDLEKVMLVDDRYDYYIALNKETPDGIVTRLQQALDQMRQDGQYDEIEKSYQ